MDNKLEVLLKWLNGSGSTSISKNIGICENELSGRGVSLIQGKLKTNEEIISIPSSHQINFHTVLYHISKFNDSLVIPGITASHKEDDEEEGTDPRFKAYGCMDKETILAMSSFQLLTLYILAEWILLPYWSNCEIESFWKPFFEIFPTEDDLKSIPAIWNSLPHSNNKQLFEILPNASKIDGIRISKLLKNDWETISPILHRWNTIFQDKSIPDLETQFTKFVHVYFVINSRCLYTEISLKEDPVDKFTMVPYVDFLNHTTEVGVHCYPKMDTFKKNNYGIGQFSIRCGSHEYNKLGEELFLNYGAHSNDFLINEYGFVVDNNDWNFIDVTPEIESLVCNPKQRDFLEAHGYWGDYTITAQDISFRILVALALIVTDDFRRVEKFMLGYISEDYFRPKLNGILKKTLQHVQKGCDAKIEGIHKMYHVDPLCARNIITIYKDYLKILSDQLKKLD